MATSKVPSPRFAARSELRQSTRAEAPPPAVKHKVIGHDDYLRYVREHDVDVAQAPSPHEVGLIAAIGYPRDRNREITRGYHRLSNALGKALGSENANWCTFAVWASRQAGVAIRGEDLGRTELAQATKKAFGSVPGFGLLTMVAKAVNGFNPYLNAAIDAIAEGNQLVFADFGRHSARFLEAFPAGVAPNQLSWGAFEAGFSAGEKEHLAMGYREYFEAKRENDPSRKAAFMLSGNLRLGYHEQKMLQPYIETALNPRGNDKAARELITRYMMTLELPKDKLHLSRAITAPRPPALDPIGLAYVDILVHHLKWKWSSGKPKGVEDWASFEQRMSYITDLFIGYQQHPELFDAPDPGLG